jgi:hypothetical protein
MIEKVQRFDRQGVMWVGYDRQACQDSGDWRGAYFAVWQEPGVADQDLDVTPEDTHADIYDVLRATWGSTDWMRHQDVLHKLALAPVAEGMADDRRMVEVAGRVLRQAG